MINYETNPSIYFKANEKFCTEIEEQLQLLKYKYSGFCNSYGYEIVTQFNRNNFEYHLKFLKNQTSRSGIIVPIDAFDFSGLELEIKTNLNKPQISYGKNKLKRLFCPKILKEKLPSPFYFSSNNKENYTFNFDLIIFLIDYKIDSFKHKNGKLSIAINQSTSNILNQLNEFEQIILNL